MTGRIIFLDWITRDMVRAEPEARFVFGDNVQRVGLGGQAGAMRGEPNAIGVATKWAPGSRDRDFFDDMSTRAFDILEADIDEVASELSEGRVIYVPHDGLGTGLSELPSRAPGLHQYIIDRFRALVPAGDAFPWGT